MPSYKVKRTGFFNGTMYSPDGKRTVLHVDKAFEVTPAWLHPIKGETAAQKGARTKAENKAKEDAEKQVKEDKVAIDAVTFTSTAEQTTQTI